MYTLFSMQSKRRTKTAMKSFNPKWNQTFVYPCRPQKVNSPSIVVMWKTYNNFSRSVLSFETLYGGQFTLSTRLIIINYSCKIVETLKPFLPWHQFASSPYFPHTFLIVLTRRICLTIKRFLSWWLFPLFSWAQYVFQVWYFSYQSLQGLEGLTDSVAQRLKDLLGCSMFSKTFS